MAEFKVGDIVKSHDGSYRFEYWGTGGVPNGSNDLAYQAEKHPNEFRWKVLATDLDFYGPEAQRAPLGGYHANDVMCCCVDDPKRIMFIHSGFLRLADPEVGDVVRVEDGSWNVLVEDGKLGRGGDLRPFRWRILAKDIKGPENYQYITQTRTGSNDTMLCRVDDPNCILFIYSGFLKRA